MAKSVEAGNQKLVPLTRRVNEAALMFSEPLAQEPEFMHAVLCQVGLPRSEVKSREFTRSTGGASMLIEAGKWYDGIRYHDMPLPYGTRPRLVLLHVCSEAIRTKSPTVEVERSASAFLERLHIKKNGESFAAFKRQMLALAACRMQIGYQTDSKIVNVKCDPIQRFDAWTQSDNGQLGLWPGEITLSNEFFETLREHAVPLDPRAIGALQNSALALDTYTWLAHRLCRVKQSRGLTLYWKSLKDQFGQEYRSDKDFKREFAGALRKARAVYPDARIEMVRGGIRLFPSPPPIKRRQVVVALPAPLAIAAPTQSSILLIDGRPSPMVSLGLSEDALLRAKNIAPGWDLDDLMRCYSEMQKSRAKPPRNLEESFLTWLKAFTRGRTPAASVAEPVNNVGKLALQDATLIEAARLAPGWDIGELEQRWRSWVEAGGTAPAHPDKAFIGWTKKFTKGKPPR